MTDWDLACFCLEIIFFTQVLVGRHFYAYVKKSNEVIKLRPACKASLPKTATQNDPGKSAGLAEEARLGTSNMQPRSAALGTLFAESGRQEAAAAARVGLKPETDLRSWGRSQAGLVSM